MQRPKSATTKINYKKVREIALEYLSLQSIDIAEIIGIAKDRGQHILNHPLHMKHLMIEKPVLLTWTPEMETELLRPFFEESRFYALFYKHIENMGLYLYNPDQIAVDT